MAMKNCSIVLPEDVAYRIRVIAAQQGTTRSALIRDLVIKYLQEHDLSYYLAPTKEDRS